MAKLSKKVIISGRELIKGAVTSNKLNNNLLFDSMPWQMVDLEDKTQEWKEWVADYFEWVGLRQVMGKAKRIIKNRRMAVGILDMEDYISGVSATDEYNYMNNYMPPTEVTDPLKKFYGIIPPFIKVLDGEFLKRDLSVFVTCTDRQTQSEKLEVKMEKVNSIVMEYAMAQKEKALQKLGLSLVPDEQIQQLPPDQQQQAQQQNEQYNSEMDVAKKLAESQSKYKKYRHVFEQFGQLVINKDYERFHMAELEREAFIETLCNAEQAWHIDMMEDGYKVEFLDNAFTFHHESRNVKYYSQGDYFGWFDDVTAGDIINKVGRRLKQHHFDQLQNSVKNLNEGGLHTGGLGLLTDDQKGFPNAYYDSTKPYPQSTGNVPMAQLMQNEAIKSISQNTINFSSSELGNIVGGNNRLSFDEPKMYRMMRLYFRSQRKIGWLTKKDRSGVVKFQGWIDEHYIPTIDAVYDNELVKTNSLENLIYGEHIDWEWANEWRHTIKISSNFAHPFWKTKGLISFDPIYIDGDPIKYHFAGSRDNPFEVEPPFEGTQYKMKGVRPVPFVEQVAPLQILHNIAMNRIPDIMFDDDGLVLAINELSAITNRPGIEASADPLEDLVNNIKKNKIISYKVDREIISQQGNSAPIIPQVLNLSRINEGLQYFQLAQNIKSMAGEVLGIAPQRLSQSKPGETATATQAGINYSESQTEPLFHQHIVEFMPRIYEKMIEAAQYYCTISESARAFYQTSDEGNAFLEVENMEGSFRKYHLKCTSDIKQKEIKAKLEQIFMQNTRSDTDMYDVALGVTNSSPSEIMENLRLAKIKKEQQQEEQYKREQEAQKQAEEAAIAQQREQQAFIEKENELNRQSAEDIATTRALGGLQSDNDTNGQLDAYQNLQAQMKQMQINLNNDHVEKKQLFDMKKHNDDVAFKDRQLLAKNSIEQKKLAVALANQQANDDKALNRKIAKDQKITK